MKIDRAKQRVQKRSDGMGGAYAAMITPFTTDIYKRLWRNVFDDALLRCGRISTVVAGILGGGFAILLVNSDLASAYEQFQRYIGILTAGLASLFVMGLFMKRVNGFGAICGLVANYIVTFGLDLVPWPGKPHLLLYGAFGLAVCLVEARLTSPLPFCLKPKKGRNSWQQEKHATGE